MRLWDLMIAKKLKGPALPSGYTRLKGIQYAGATYYKITGFKLKSSDTVRISASFSQACNVFGCYTTNEATDNYSLYMSTTAGSKYLRYGNGTYASYCSSSNLNKRFNMVITPTGSRGLPGTNDTWTAGSFTASVDMCIGTTSTSATSAKMSGKIYGNIVVDGRLCLIPCKRTSDDVIGYYDAKGETFYEPTGTAPTPIT